MTALACIAPLGLAPSSLMTVTSRSTVPRMDFSEISTKPVPWTSNEISDKAGMNALAMKLNPSVGFWDPLNIVGFETESSKETIGWFRHAEIKHGRVAMAAFVGFIAQSNGVHFPWLLQGPLGPTLKDVAPISFGDIAAAGGPGDQWDALPSAAKLQILIAIGFLEMVSETSYFLDVDGQQHYVRGGKPGYFPKLKGKFPHWVPLNLWDPFGVTQRMSPERKEKALLAEINNGRLAMIGIIGMLAASKGLIVPGLDSLGIAPYSGEYMAPFSAVNSDLSGVSEMLQLKLPFN